MADGDQLYRFESLGRLTSHVKAGEVDQDFRTFMGRLGITADVLGANDQFMRNYVFLHHAKIHWYVTRMRKELRYRALFIAFSVLLLVMIPVLLVGLGMLPKWFGVQGTAFATAQVTGVITGLIAIHRVLSTWLEKRRLIVHFHKASAALKAGLYSLEDKWRGRAVDAGKRLKAEFVDDVKRGIESALQITKEEEEAYFEYRAGLPSINIMDTLKSVQNDVAALAAKLKPSDEQ